MRRRFRWIAGAIFLVLLLAGVVLYTPDIPVESLRPKCMSASSRFVEVDGAAIHVRDEGNRDGPVLILIHGSNASLHVWEPWVLRLKDSFRLVSLDLPGHGLTGPWRRDDYSIAAYADLTTRIADLLQIQRFAVGGHSMGGAVASSIAARQPQRITRLVLIDAAAYPRGEGQLPLTLRLAQTPLVGELVAMLKPRWMVERTLRQTYADPARLGSAEVQRHHDLLRREGNRDATLRRLRTATPLDPKPLKSLNVPTLILWGAQDRWAPLADARRLHRDVAGSELVIYDDAGHVPMEEVPDRSAADVRRFLLK